jgi:hypothetical protein
MAVLYQVVFPERRIFPVLAPKKHYYAFYRYVVCRCVFLYIRHFVFTRDSGPLAHHSMALSMYLHVHCADSNCLSITVLLLAWHSRVQSS